MNWSFEKRVLTPAKNHDDALAKRCGRSVMSLLWMLSVCAWSGRLTHGVAKFAPLACPGICCQPSWLHCRRLWALKSVLAIVGGSKLSTKLEVLESLADICDRIIVGGGIANAFLAAAGCTRSDDPSMKKT